MIIGDIALQKPTDQASPTEGAKTMLFFVVVGFLLTGGAYVTFRRGSFVLGTIMTVVLLCLPVVLLILWLNDRSGVSSALESSAVWIAGRDSVGDIYPKEGCAPGTEANWLVIFGLIVSLVGILSAAIAILAIPIGLIVTFVGAWLLFIRYIVIVRAGLVILAIGLAGIILSGLSLRLINWLYDGPMCVPN